MASVSTSSGSNDMELQHSDIEGTLDAGEMAPRTSSASMSVSTNTAMSDNITTNLIAQVTSFAGSYSNLNELFEKSWNSKYSALPPQASWRDESVDFSQEHSSCSSAQHGRSHEPAFYDAYNMYSRTAHMGILDPSYDVFTSEYGRGALIYKVKNRTAVITGDPLCPASQFDELLKEFQRKKQLKVAFMGTGQQFAEYAADKGWTTMHFGRERVLNPLTNKVLRQLSGKRMITQSRRLLDPKRIGLVADIYAPGRSGRDSALETEIQNLYDQWRMERNSKNEGGTQAFVTVYDLFSDPDITFYLYLRDREGSMVGLAVLRSLGANCGFHLDPCIASSTAPSGVTDLLVLLSMILLRGTGIAYLSFGYEPFPEICDISGQQTLKASLTRWGYRRVLETVNVGGKVSYHDKFHPDESLESNLYTVIPKGPLQVQQSAAIMHVANIKLRRLLLSNRR
ncbi:unnamed protein product [Clonostachys byssicola]|uniref:Phosphatidylglycerol lysyltransferase C-terminal domain-containing protein n=1 Tax=Clonostachys byssicola TaxID=160290 RepID=A0A9N9UL93_9HYPO|nr:unnamed protein product [Clonostachys byssicola]